MVTTQDGSKFLVGAETVESVETTASASEGLRGVVTTAEHDLVDQCRPSDPAEEPDSLETDDVNMSDAQPTPLVHPRPQLKLMNPDRPVRYIPIHVWYVLCALETKGQNIEGCSYRFFHFRPEHLKKVQPRTGRRYSPKRSRTLVPKRNEPSPRTLKSVAFLDTARLLMGL